MSSLRKPSDDVRGWRLFLPPSLRTGTRRRWVLGWMMASTWPLTLTFGVLTGLQEPVSGLLWLMVTLVSVLGLPLLHRGLELVVLIAVLSTILLTSLAIIILAPANPGSPAGLVIALVLAGATERARTTLFVWGLSAGILLLPLLSMSPQAYASLPVGSNLASRVSYLIIVGAVAVFGSAASNRLLTEARQRSAGNRRLAAELESNLQTLELQVAERTEALQRRTAELEQISHELDDSIAREVALADEMRHLAETDDLTGLPNRRGFMNALTSTLSQLDADPGETAWLALVDLDHFKLINDTFGHPVGDQVLRRVARVLSRVAPHGATARIGGEEFAIVFRDRDLRGGEPAEQPVDCEAAAQRVVHAVRELTWPELSPAGEDWRVTVSLGAAELAVGEAQSAISDLLRRADAALYTAKALGRDRAVVSTC